MVSDNDKGAPSTLGFAEEALSVNRADTLTVKVPIRREGGMSYNVTVHYETVDGTAKAGVDYAAASGELSFAGSIDEIEVPIALIANDATEERSFTVRLTELRGGGEEELCALETEEITVTLYGISEPSVNGAGKNLATLLAENDGEEVAGSVTVSDSPLLADNREALQGSTFMEASEPITAELTIHSDTRSHPMDQNYYSFSRPSNYDEYWCDWEALLGEAVWYGKDIADTQTEYKSTSTTYGNVLSSDDTDFKNNVLKNRKNETKSGTRRNYTAQLTDANFSGNFYFGRDSSVLPFPTGNYFNQFALDVEWEQTGFQQTDTSELRHRYLLPTVILTYGPSNNGGNTTLSCEFDVDADRTDKFPEYQTIRCYTDWSNGLYRDNSYVSDSGNGWSDGSGMNTSTQPYGTLTLGYGKDIEINIDLTHKMAWLKDNTTSLKGLMTRLSHVDIRRFQAQRRFFTHKTIDLMLYTSNDLDEAGNAIALTADSPVYGYLAPTVSLTKNRSGVRTSGELYAGSTLTVTTKEYAGFRVAENGVFLTNSSGERVNCKIVRQNNIFYITMMWEGFNADALHDEYTLNVIYDRKQTISIDIVPSVPRKQNSSQIDTDKIAETWTEFMSNTPSGTCVLRSAGAGSEGTVFNEIGWFMLYEDDFTGAGGVYTNNVDITISNLQTINFRQRAQDVIVFNKRAYAGDATITLTEEDLALENLYFIFYKEEFRRVVSPMQVKIDRVELYYDGNGNQKIDGSMNGSSFVPTDGDVMIDTLRGDYPDVTFKPVLDEDGKTAHQYYFKVFYTIRPRALDLPAGASSSDRAQILTAFKTSITDPSEIRELAPELQSFRYIASNNTDGIVMYGATGLSYLDIPLGGDVSQVKLHTDETVIREEDEYEPVLDANGKEVLGEDGEVKMKLVREGHVVDSYTESWYSWDPNYTGKILIPFANPTQVVNSDNATGKSVPLGGSDKATRNQKLNAYFASFCDRTTFALGIQQQAKPSSQLRTLSELEPETMTMGTVFSTPTPDSLADLTLGGDPGPAEGQGPGGAIDRKEFAPDLGTKLPNLEFELGDYATIVMDGYNVGFTVGIPVFHKEETTYASDQNTTTNANGWKTESGINEAGNAYEHIESPDGKTVTDVEIILEPNNPNSGPRPSKP